jgi:hypothetical protein
MDSTASTPIELKSRFLNRGKKLDAFKTGKLRKRTDGFWGAYSSEERMLFSIG